MVIKVFTGIFRISSVKHDTGYELDKGVPLYYHTRVAMHEHDLTYT